MSRLTVVFAILAVVAVGSTEAVEIIRVPGDAASLSVAMDQIGNGGVIEMATGSYVAPADGFQIVNPGKSFTIRAAPGASVTLTGSGSKPILKFLNPNPDITNTVVFEDLVFANGWSGVDGTAGGVTLSQATATFNRCLFTDNQSHAPETGGGGVAVFTNSLAHFFDCEWTDNVAKNEGAGLRVGEGSSAYVYRARFTGNRTNLPGHRPSSVGGGIHVTDARLWVANSRFEGNRAGFVGGAIFAFGTWAEPLATPVTELVVTNCTFEDNLARPAAGVTPPSPPAGGAIHTEDHTTAIIVSSRFVANSAESGGAMSMYRSLVEIDDCTFKGNFATGVGNSAGKGGTLTGSSNDIANVSTAGGTINRRSSELTLRDSLIHGISGGGGVVGGCVYLSGDTNRSYGRNGMDPMGTPLVNRARLDVYDSVFFDCDVLRDPGTDGTGKGGAIGVSHVALTVQDSLFAGCDAVGTNASGGAVRTIVESDVVITGSTFADNSAEGWGAGMDFSGSSIQLSSCQFFDHQLGSGTEGSAVYSAPADNMFGSFDFDMTGQIETTVFSDNDGIAIREFDWAQGPINDVRYNDNEFFTVPTNDDVYRNNLAGPAITSAELNDLVVVRNGGVGNTIKSTVDNSALSGRPDLGALVAVPPFILPVNAIGDPPPPTDSYLGYAWHGSSATLDGVTLTLQVDLIGGGTGTHTLVVGGEQYQESIGLATEPVGSLVGIPPVINSGQASNLGYSISGGSFLGATIDRGVMVTTQASSGVKTVHPSATTVYSLFGMSQAGGATSIAVVAVDEDPTAIFSDDFEMGNTAAWSATVE